MFPMVLMMTIMIRTANIVLSCLPEDFWPIATPNGAANNSPPTNGRNKPGNIYPHWSCDRPKILG